MWHRLLLYKKGDPKVFPPLGVNIGLLRPVLLLVVALKVLNTHTDRTDSFLKAVLG